VIQRRIVRFGRAALGEDHLQCLEVTKDEGTLLHRPKLSRINRTIVLRAGNVAGDLSANDIHLLAQCQKFEILDRENDNNRRQASGAPDEADGNESETSVKPTAFDVSGGRLTAIA
jgi:hypothetical protein